MAESKISRRVLIGTSALVGTGSLLSLGCGGGGDAEAAGAPAPGSSTPGTTPTTPGTGAPAAVGASRDQQAYLFQSVATAAYPSTLGGGSFNTDGWGPTAAYVDFYSGWSWRNRGGDWLDAKGVSQGAEPWFSAPVDAVSGSAATNVYTGIDVSAVVAHCQREGRWLALLLRARGAPRSMATNFHATLGGPAIQVTYADGTQATLGCRLVAASTAGSTLPLSTRASLPLPCFVEFERPVAAVRSAALRWAITEHWSGAAAFVDGFLCDPPREQVSGDGPQDLASQAGALDAGIDSLAGVIGAQRYLDGRPLSDFAVTGRVPSVTSESSFDPALWGGASDARRFPHTVVGKWVNVPDRLSLVDSSYRGEGFQPLRPGLGALRVVMPDGGIQTGKEGGYTGTTAMDARLFMPFEDMGVLSHIFVRQYLRLGSPYVRKPADRREVLQSGQPKWSDMGGKFGISASHATTYGGVSGSSGGGTGWQMRWAWSECEAGVGGPDETGLMPGWHLYDFQTSNPVGYRYGGEGQNANNWGQLGPRGAVLYAGHWYCVETEIKLNTVNATDNSFLPDGLLRTWIDGKLAYERTGMVFRTLPLHRAAYDGSFIRPFRELGVKELWWNWYHGGTTQSTVERTLFVSGLVWARARIGPMKA